MNFSLFLALKKVCQGTIHVPLTEIRKMHAVCEFGCQEALTHFGLNNQIRRQRLREVHSRYMCLLVGALKLNV